MIATAWLSIFLLSSAPGAQAQRLPKVAVPEHYSLALTPNLKDATFAGSETIDLTLSRPTESITLNAAEIKFVSVVAVVDGRELKGAATTDDQKE
jgi:aminopeptidase N/puromycin-sensitive aminopeptidase